MAFHGDYDIARDVCHETQKNLNEEYDSIYFELKNIAWKLYDLTCDFKQLQLGTEIVEWNDLFSNNSTVNTENRTPHHLSPTGIPFPESINNCSPPGQPLPDSINRKLMDIAKISERYHERCNDEGVTYRLGNSPKVIFRPPPARVHRSSNEGIRLENPETFLPSGQHSPRYEIERLLEECELPPEYSKDIRKNNEKFHQRKVDDNLNLPTPSAESSRHPNTQFSFIISEKRDGDRERNFSYSKMSNTELQDELFKRYDSMEEMAYKLNLPRSSVHSTPPKSYVKMRHVDASQYLGSQNRKVDGNCNSDEQAFIDSLRDGSLHQHGRVDPEPRQFSNSVKGTDTRSRCIGNFYENISSVRGRDEVEKEKRRPPDWNMYDNLRKELETDVKLRKFLPRTTTPDEKGDNVFVIDTQNFKILAFPRKSLSDFEEY